MLLQVVATAAAPGNWWLVTRMYDKYRSVYAPCRMPDVCPVAESWVKESQARTLLHLVGGQRAAGLVARLSCHDEAHPHRSGMLCFMRGRRSRRGGEWIKFSKASQSLNGVSLLS